MNIRKALLLTLIIAIASLGLTLTGCDKKSDHPTASTEAVEEAVEEAAAEEIVEEAVEEAAAEHPTEHPE
jgi:hypothetical protein